MGGCAARTPGHMVPVLQLIGSGRMAIEFGIIKGKSGSQPHRERCSVSQNRGGTW